MGILEESKDFPACYLHPAQVPAAGDLHRVCQTGEGGADFLAALRYVLGQRRGHRVLQELFIQLELLPVHFHDFRSVEIKREDPYRDQDGKHQIQNRYTRRKRYFHTASSRIVLRNPSRPTVKRLWELLLKFRGAVLERHSALPGRDINSRMASRGERPSFKMACICSAMGISTRCFLARPRVALVVSTPSATMPCIPAMISGSPRPLPSAAPTLRFRESPPVQVRTRSPMPAKPASVCGLAPHATARRVISARPRVISAATEL